MRSTSGRYRWVHCRAIAVSAVGQPTHRIVGSLSDIDDRKVLEDQLRRYAMHDALTGLPNRALLVDRLAAALDAAPDGRPALDAEGVTVLFIDLDGFKEVNDTRGHAAGDKLLIAVADRLRAAIRSHDIGGPVRRGRVRRPPAHPRPADGPAHRRPHPASDRSPGRSSRRCGEGDRERRHRDGPAGQGDR